MRRPHHSGRHCAKHHSGKAPVEAPDAVCMPYARAGFCDALQAWRTSMKHRWLAAVKGRTSDTLNPEGIVDDAICRVLMTLIGYSIVVTPCPCDV